MKNKLNKPVHKPIHKPVQWLAIAEIVRSNPIGWFMQFELQQKYSAATIRSLVKNEFLERKTFEVVEHGKAKLQNRYRLTGKGRLFAETNGLK